MAFLRFFARRLLLALPTLVGISLVTFALVHLAPGDVTNATPGGGGRLLSRRDAAAQRRLFFLDLPLFFNSSPRGLGARLGRLCGPKQLASAKAAARERGLERALGCGTLCLRPIALGQAECKRLPAKTRQTFAAALRRRAPKLSGQTATLEAWTVAAAKRVEPARLARWTATLGSSNNKAVRELTTAGSAALAPAIEALLAADPASNRARAASLVVTRLTGIGGQLLETQSPRTRAATLDRWREWWRQQRRDYVRFGGWQRIHGHLSETRYAKWISRLLRFDFGYSLHDGRAVSDKLAEALPVTLLLSFLSMLLAYLLAVPIGVHAAARRGTRGERAITVVLFLLYSLPPFWVAMLLILAFGGVGMFDVFPIHGLSSPNADQFTALAWLLDRIWHLILPVFCLTYGSLAVLSRYQRGAMLEALAQDYVRTARAKGLSERRVLWRHALPNALLPTITLLGLHFPFLISGSVIIERIFNIPGMGLLTFHAFLQRDYPVIMAVSVLSAALTLLGLILTDVLYALADPRISLDERARGALGDVS